jgi:excisionase family DNA binding protein
MEKSLLVSRREAAALLGLSLRMLDYLVARREISVRRVGRRVLVPRHALEMFANSARCRASDRDD